jgi:Mg2+/citrate symporter
VAERVFAAFLSLILVLGMFPVSVMRTSAEEAAPMYGTVDAYTQGLTITGSGSDAVVVSNGEITLDWVAADASIGRVQDGWWVGFKVTAPAGLTEEQLKMRRPHLIIVNWILILGVLGMMVVSLLAPVVSFMIGVCLALVINYRDPQTQRNLIEEKGKDAILLCSVIFAAGILMGIMGQSGMSGAMANTMVKLIPSSLSGLMAPIVGILSVPLSILFDPDSYYYGIMPIIVEVAETLGVNGVDIARASIIGQITLGWPLSPMIGTFFLFTGMCELDIGEWQKYAFKYFFLIGIFMTGFACLTGLFG